MCISLVAYRAISEQVNGLMKMNQDEIKGILPHREPMLLVTSVEELSPGENIRAAFFASPEMDIFRGHFPEEPILPGVYSIECMAQAVDILLMSTVRYAGKTPLLLGVDKLFIVHIRARQLRQMPIAPAYKVAVS